MSGLKKARRDGREEPIALDDEMFRVVPADSAEDLQTEPDPPAGATLGTFDLDDDDGRYVPEAPERGGSKAIWLTLAGLIALAVLGWAAWIVLAPVPQGSPGSGDLLATVEPSMPAVPDLPLVRADTSPYKTPPDEPGGLQVENTDKRVYGRLSETARAETDPAVEQLLPGPARPVPPPAPVPAPAPAAPANGSAGSAGGAVPGGPDTAAVGPSRGTESTSFPAATPASDAPATSEGPGSPGVPGIPAVPALPGAESAGAAGTDTPADETAGAAETPAPAPASASAAPPASADSAAPENVAAAAEAGPQVQLAAFRARILAERQWEALREAHPDLLGDLPHVVAFADLGDRGQFYRLRAGPFSTTDQAETLCRTLKQRDVECLVVRE